MGDTFFFGRVTATITARHGSVPGVGVVMPMSAIGDRLEDIVGATPVKVSNASTGDPVAVGSLVRLARIDLDWYVDQACGPY